MAVGRFLSRCPQLLRQEHSSNVLRRPGLRVRATGDGRKSVQPPSVRAASCPDTGRLARARLPLRATCAPISLRLCSGPAASRAGVSCPAPRTGVSTGTCHAARELLRLPHPRRSLQAPSANRSPDGAWHTDSADRGGGGKGWAGAGSGTGQRQDLGMNVRGGGLRTENERVQTRTGRPGR